MQKISRKTAAELLAVCKELIRYHEEMDASPNCYEYGFKADLATRLYDAVAAFLKEQIAECTGIVAENSELLAKICQAKSDDQLRFLDEKPFRIAILRLNAAVLQARTACGETVAKPN